MLIRCSDTCKFQQDGACGLKNIYSSSAAAAQSVNEISDSGCIYYQPRRKSGRKKIPENQKNVTRANQGRQKYF